MLSAPLKKSSMITDIKRKGCMLCLSAACGTLYLEPKLPNIVRVVYITEGDYNPETTEGMLETPSFTDWSYHECDSYIEATTSMLKISIDRKTMSVSYRDALGNLLLSEASQESHQVEGFDSHRAIENGNAKSHYVDTPDGRKLIIDSVDEVFDKRLYRSRLKFKWQDDEKLFGFGQNENGDFNIIGTTQYVYQKNKRIAIPFLQSTKGYGLLLDTYSPIIFHSTLTEGDIYNEAATCLSYYFIAGSTMDETIKGYRYLTGKAPLFPKWAYGFIQSMERYETSDDLINCVKRHRDEGVGIDCVVLDWRSWEGDLWGEKIFDASRFPDPDKMMDELHRLNSHLIISIWPRLDKRTQNYAELKKEGGMLPNSTIYNPLNADTRKLYWKQAYEGLFCHGIDAWWCDDSEPVHTEWTHNMEPPEELSYYQNYTQLSKILPQEYASAFSLFHAKGIYEGQRSETNEKRVFNLTRSAYTGQQRYATCMWSGDTYASWGVLKNHIVSGLQFCASGLPYWTFDIGAFFTKKGERWFRNGDYNNGTDDLGYCELYTRWYQLGTFMPIFRSHGTDTWREIWNFKKPETSMFYDAIKASNKLRYLLMPTIYSLAYKVWKDDYTMLRMLSFDFKSDPKALEIKDEFMFGGSLLICPVTEPIYYGPNSEKISHPQLTRKVYLPQGYTWTDFHTGTVYGGGQEIILDVSLDRIPIFVRSGSILFKSQFYNHTGENTANDIIVDIYGGCSAQASLFLDDNDNYSYEKGNYCEIAFTWNDEDKCLTIDEPKGTWWSPEKHASFTIRNNNESKTVEYKGVPEVISFK